MIILLTLEYVIAAFIAVVGIGCCVAMGKLFYDGIAGKLDTPVVATPCEADPYDLALLGELR